MRATNLLRNAAQAYSNLVRSLRRRGIEGVVLPVDGAYPEWSRREPLPFPFHFLAPLWPGETSLEDMRAALERLGSDPRVHTVVLHFGSLHAGTSALYSLRHMCLDLRAKGKHLAAWLPGADPWHYYLASACDEIFLPPSSRLSILGLRAEAFFLKDALSLVGVEADLEAIAEYKASPDTFRRSTMTEPHREMLDAIVDSYFDELVAAIAEGRGLTPGRVRELIDAMPLLPEEAVETGLADEVLYEDELESRLLADGGALCTWQEAAPWLRRPIKWITPRAIGVISLEGIIMPGHSRRVPMPLPFLGGGQAGADTVAQALRRAEADPRIAAVILHVDSPGGSPLASDLISREVRRLRQHKPVVVLMGEYAASGGYYVSALASHIVARPTTLTGSIGIWGGKFSLAGLYEKLGIGRASLQRGAMASLYADTALFDEPGRTRIRRDLGAYYAAFKAIVGEGRGMTEEQVEEIARGRLWTGAQAREIGLVDELGDFTTALEAAKKLAKFTPRQQVPVVKIQLPRRGLLPPPFAATGQAWVAARETLQALARERVWALAPWVVQIKGET